MLSSTDGQELISRLFLELIDLWQTVEDDEDDADAEDHSLIELAGDTLEDILVDLR